MTTQTEPTARLAHQYSTFYIGKQLYGIDVMEVQEVTQALPLTAIPRAPKYVHGLINLRGQIATAIGLHDLFGSEATEIKTPMNVVCKADGALIALLVDRIGDVIEVEEDQFERTPDTIPGSVSRFMEGVFKTSGPLLSVIEVNRLSKFLNENGKRK